MIVQILLAAAGLLLLTLAADHLVLGASRLASRMRISPVVVGVVVIGLGTSAPEFLVSGVAAVRGDAGIAVGNIAGSNLLNVTLILGLAALAGKLAVTAQVIKREIPLAAAAVVVFGVLAFTGLSLLTGAVLTVLSVAVLALLLRWATAGRRADLELAEDVQTFTDATATVDLSVAPSRLAGWIEPVRTVLGLAGVLAGAQLLVTNAAAIATGMGVPQVIIGLTLVALGTSLPELVTTIQAQRRGESDLVVGNLFGSNLFNSLIGGAVIGLATGNGPPATAPAALTIAMIFTSLLAWALLRRGLRLTKIDAAVLLAVYALTIPLLLAG